MTDEEPPMSFLSFPGEEDARYDDDNSIGDVQDDEEFATVPTSDSFENRAVKTGYLFAEPTGDSVKIKWCVDNPMPKDWIGLFIHERLRDYHYLLYHETKGMRDGEVVFHNLARGYYDVRFFENGSRYRSSTVDMCVFCIGRGVEISANLVDPKTIEITWPREFTDSGNWVALFERRETSNWPTKALSMKYLKDAETAAIIPRIFLPAPRKPGDYQVRFFFRTSSNLDRSNVYSGKVDVTIPNQDKMEAIFNPSSDEPKLIVKWQTHTIEPDDWNWIGLYESSDEKARRIADSYVSNNRVTICRYTSDDHEQGIIEFPTLPDELRYWAETSTKPTEVGQWELRFHQVSTINKILRGSNDPVVYKCPCFPDSNPDEK